MTQKSFVINDVLGWGWRVMKANIFFFLGVGLLYAIVTMLPDILKMYIQMALPILFLDIVSFILGIIVAIGMIKIALSFCDQVKPSIGTLFDAWDCFWRYLGVTILYLLIVLGGTLLLIIPGIIWAVKYQYGFYFVIDKGLGPIGALKASAQTTQGVKWDLFGFGILCGLINMLGLICLIVGMFATYPTTLLATALVYRHLLAQTPQLAEFGITLPQPQPESEPSEPEPFNTQPSDDEDI